MTSAAIWTSAETRTRIVVRGTTNSADGLAGAPSGDQSPPPEVIMNRTSHRFARLAALATMVLGLVLVTVGPAAARILPDPSGPGDVPGGRSTASVQQVTDSSVSPLPWVLFAVAVLGALVIGAALMRHRGQLAH
ncbi:MAG: hypothetical protein ACRDPB_02735 [Nocardioidaceae bacterium]